MRPFLERHLGPDAADRQEMLAALGCASMEQLVDEAVPAAIRSAGPLDLPAALGEAEALAELRGIAAENRVLRSHIGLGYHDCITPPVIRRCILENPGWYTQYTPYQAEISQGRLEALLNFQTVVADLTGLPIANASLLDEATAAAEAMAMCRRVTTRANARVFFAADSCHPQTLAVLRTRAEPLGIVLLVGDPATFRPGPDCFGGLIQYPATDGAVVDPAPFIETMHQAGALAVVATDLLALTLLRPPGELGADVAVGSAQRFGVPFGFGGPHAAFLSTRDQFKRTMPGRMVGLSRDAHGQPALRLALQTREQHIRRDKATSNICTAQVLLAVMASMYAVYHGPDGLREIARGVRAKAGALAAGLRRMGFALGETPFFDTLRVDVGEKGSAAIIAGALKEGINLRALDGRTVCVALDEAPCDLDALLRAFNGNAQPPFAAADLLAEEPPALPAGLARTSDFLTHPVFRKYRSETELLRYIHRLESRDLSLTTSMIPLGSCTMKLNAAAEMLPVTWPEFAAIHPCAPSDQTRGYARVIADLQRWLGEITGLPAVSLQPNAGSQGEYAGLLAICGYHRSRGDGRRDACLIPVSAHGTNPASAVIAGLRVIPVGCTPTGDIDLEDLRARANEHRDRLAALMITYPSTHGVFEETVVEACAIVHEAGGQVYMDGANMNAQVGLTSPARIGADVCHLNLHKTFCIPHGGGGPGVGPICGAAHLAPFLPGDPMGEIGPEMVGPVSAAHYGSAGILVIPWMYIRMMGPEGLADATRTAILNANYIARRLGDRYPILYAGPKGRVAHECILDLRPIKQRAGVDVEDVAKRLMDYGFHSPTMSWPVAGTLMVEPTESESRAELDRFCDAMIAIHDEIRAVESGQMDAADNPLKNAPHTAAAVAADDWPHRYPRAQAAYPAPWLREYKFWPPVGRVDNVYGDRNLVCACPSVESFAAS